MKEYKKYKGSNWEFSQLGNAKYNGQIKNISTGKVYINGQMLNVSDIICELFKETAKASIKPLEQTTNLNYVHGNKGKKHSLETINKIAKSKNKAININGIAYNSIKQASKELNVNRSTIYRINKKALQT